MTGDALYAIQLNGLYGEKKNVVWIFLKMYCDSEIFEATSVKRKRRVFVKIEREKTTERSRRCKSVPQWIIDARYLCRATGQRDGVR